MRRRTVLATTSAAASAAAPAVDSLQRGLEALRCFRQGEDLLGLAELALRLDLPRATTLRLLQTLETHGFVRRLPGSEQFGLNVGCLFVGQALLRSSTLVREARPVLRNLADRFKVHVLLCVPERRDLLALFHADGKGAKLLPLGAGLTLPVASTAFGYAWLWTQSPLVQGEWLARLRAEAPGREAGSAPVATIYQAFHDIEKQGVCFSMDAWRRSVAMVASPLVLRDGATAAFGCLRAGAETGDAPFDAECGPALRDAADEIRDAVHRATSQ